MFSSMLLTFRMHRFEVAFAAVLLVLTGVSALVAGSHVAAANATDECWKNHWSALFEGNAPFTVECEEQINKFWGAASEASFVASPLAVSLPFVVGLLLGVPIVGRELEMRTAGLAWSLTGRRWRWLASRFVPVLILGAGGLLVVSLLVADMARIAHPWNYLGPGRIPDLTEVGSEGLPLAARGLMTLGIGLLAGALLGRTLPAFAIGIVVCFMLLFVGKPFLQAQVGQSVAVWQPTPGSPGIPEDTGPVLYVPGLSETAFRAADGTILSYDQVMQQCGACEEPSPVTYQPIQLVAPIESYPIFENAEMIVTSTIGLACIALAFPVVTRRRPA